MLWIIFFIIFVLCFGGILEKVKFIEVIFERIVKYIYFVGSFVVIIIVIGIFCDFVLID